MNDTSSQDLDIVINDCFQKLERIREFLNNEILKQKKKGELTLPENEKS